jgi:hypothetical protein
LSSFVSPPSIQWTTWWTSHHSAGASHPNLDRPPDRRRHRSGAAADVERPALAVGDDPAHGRVTRESTRRLTGDRARPVEHRGVDAGTGLE